MKTYISGRISGLPINDVMTKFNLAEKTIIASGHEPINPLKIEGYDVSLTWKQHMCRDIKELFNCEAILMLNDWRDSRGARIEHAIAKETGIIIYYE
jgi:hypothetical protein